MKEQEAQAKLSLKLQAYQYLKTKILNCEYRPNEFLNEQKLCAEMGIINPTILKQARGVAIVIIFFIAAVVTPPDIVSQCMVAGPMVLLYFISIFLSGIFYKPHDTDEDDEDEEEEEAESKD